MWAAPFLFAYDTSPYYLCFLNYPMIPAVQIIDRIQSALDSEGFDRYTWERDFRPAINYAQEWVTSVFSSAMGSNKFNEEGLQDLSYSRIWKTNRFSRFVFQPSIVGHNLWTIVAIYPECIVTPATDIVQPNLDQSVYSPTHSFVSSYKSAARKTAEEMNLNRLNPFAAGNEVVTCPELMDYAYKSLTNYTGGYDPSVSGSDMEIEILPSYKNKVLCMEYLKYPTPLVNEVDSVEYPLSIMNMIVEKALGFISFKQAGTPLNQASNADLDKLITLMA